MMRRIRKCSSSQGFTLLELIVVVGIIGVIAAIAIPQYGTYKSRAVDSQMQSALKNARTAMEAYYIDHNDYPAPGKEALLEGEGDKDYGYRPTDGVTLEIVKVTEALDYTLRACANGGSADSWVFSTNDGKTERGGSCEEGS